MVLAHTMPPWTDCGGPHCFPSGHLQFFVKLIFRTWHEVLVMDHLLPELCPLSLT